MDRLETEAWLYHGAFSFSSAIQGELRLADGRLNFVAIGYGGKKRGGVKESDARWLEELAGTSGVAEGLMAGQPQTILDVPASEVEAKSKSLGTLLYVNAQGRKYRFALYDFGRARSMPLVQAAGVGRGKPWKQALARAREPGTAA
jgi:hypothetical protein